MSTFDAVALAVVCLLAGFVFSAMIRPIAPVQPRGLSAQRIRPIAPVQPRGLSAQRITAVTMEGQLDVLAAVDEAGLMGVHPTFGPDDGYAISMVDSGVCIADGLSYRGATKLMDQLGCYPELLRSIPLRPDLARLKVTTDPAYAVIKEVVVRAGAHAPEVGA